MKRKMREVAFVFCGLMTMIMIFFSLEANAVALITR